MTRPNHVWVLSQKDHSIGWGLSYRYHTCEKLYCWILFSNNEKSISLLTFCSSGLSSTILLSQKVFICFVSKTFFNCLLWADHLLSTWKGYQCMWVYYCLLLCTYSKVCCVSVFACLHERSYEGILSVHGKCYLTLPCFFVPVTISELPQYGRMAKCSRETTLIHHTGCLFFMTLGPLASFFIFLFKSVAYDGQLLFLFCLLSSPWGVCSPVIDQFVRKRKGKRKKK